MMKVILIGVAVFILSAGCNNAAHKPTAKTASLPTAPAPAYYFYPKANVYFDSVNKNYTFLSSNGKTWQTEKQIPAAMLALMDKNVFIPSPSNPVWKDNENHKVIYSALLYAAPTDTQPEKVVKPAIIETPKPEPKKRSGLRRFFDKIFGRKKKDTANH